MNDTPEQHAEAIRSQEGGSEALAVPEIPVQEDLRQFKVVGQVIASVHNGAGEIIGERAIAHVEIHRANFGKLPEVAKETVETYVETEAQMQQAASEKSG